MKKYEALAPSTKTLSNETITIEKIDALLPQTQCGLCDYDGCRPYAKAIVEKGEQIDHCPPGGIETLIALAELTNQDSTPFLADMKQKAKLPSLAVIREDECIGCTKCIQACPTDAILGAGKLMHTIISDACTGCELCIEPCPVDCIDMVTIAKRTQNDKEIKAIAWRDRYEKRNNRLERDKKERQQKHEIAKLGTLSHQTLAARQTAIEAAVMRTKAKRLKNRNVK